jgi:hypothetical protein
MTLSDFSITKTGRTAAGATTLGQPSRAAAGPATRRAKRTEKSNIDRIRQRHGPQRPTSGAGSSAHRCSSWKSRTHGMRRVIRARRSAGPRPVLRAAGRPCSARSLFPARLRARRTPRPASDTSGFSSGSPLPAHVISAKSSSGPAGTQHVDGRIRGRLPHRVPRGFRGQSAPR